MCWQSQSYVHEMNASQKRFSDAVGVALWENGWFVERGVERIIPNWFVQFMGLNKQFDVSTITDSMLWSKYHCATMRQCDV